MWVRSRGDHKDSAILQRYEPQVCKNKGRSGYQNQEWKSGVERAFSMTCACF
jgi:hypothetical protein